MITSKKGKIKEIKNYVVDVEFTSDIPDIYNTLRIEGIEEGLNSYLEVQEHIDTTTVRCISFGNTDELMIGLEVKNDIKGPYKIPEGRNLLGRVINSIAESLDGMGPIEYPRVLPIHSSVPEITEVEYIVKPIITGIKVIDFLIPFAFGKINGIFGVAGAGKTTIQLQLIKGFTEKIKELMGDRDKTYVVFIGTGERITEGKNLYSDLKEHGMFDPNDPRVVLAYGQMGESAGSRSNIVNIGIAIAKDLSKYGNVVIFVDNTYRYLQANSELSNLLDIIPSTLGYTPTLDTVLGRVQDHITNVKGNYTISSIQNILIPANDENDPCVVAVKSYLDSFIWLSKEMFSGKLTPAIDPLKSSSCLLNSKTLGDRHYKLAIKTKEYLKEYYRLKDIIAIFGTETLDTEVKTRIHRSEIIINYFTQPLSVSEKFTNILGVSVDLNDILDDITNIFNGKYDSISPKKFYMIGKIDESKL